MIVPLEPEKFVATDVSGSQIWLVRSVEYKAEYVRPAATGEKARLVPADTKLNIEAGFVGFRPVTYLKRLFWPVPSASVLVWDCGQSSQPKYWICHAW